MVFFAVVVVLTSTVFSLASVELKFLSTTINLTDEQAILQSVDFRYGENVLLANKKSYIAQIEKQNPYIRVLNIETIFPNKYIINAVERTETYVFKMDNNKYAKTDENLKVLSISNVYQNNTENGIQIKNSALTSQTNIVEGDFFVAPNGFLKGLFDCFREWNDSYAAIKSKIESVELNYNNDEQRILINMRSGVQIIVRKVQNNLSDKLNLAFSFYDLSVDIDGNPVDYTKSGIIEVFETDAEIYASYRHVS